MADMLYAIKAVGTPFVKFGLTRGDQIGKRLAQLQVGCPYELALLAIADWPDASERQIHWYLGPLLERGEWFSEGERTSHVLRLMTQGSAGLEALIAATVPAPKPRMRKSPRTSKLGRKL